LPVPDAEIGCELFALHNGKAPKQSAEVGSGRRLKAKVPADCTVELQ
jgi:hypothetical protein